MAARESPDLHPRVPQSRQPMGLPIKYPDLPKSPKVYPTSFTRIETRGQLSPGLVLPVTDQPKSRDRDWIIIALLLISEASSLRR